ncbi:MAG: HepT-like ribonuclease domain-containing protein [Acidimicrobiia bacterium]
MGFRRSAKPLKGSPRDCEPKHPEVPWRQIVDMRNLPAHGHRHVDPAIVWQVVVRDLPGLRDEIHAIVDRLGEN